MDPMLLILIFGGGAAVILLVIGVVVTARSERSLVEERLGRYLAVAEDEYALDFDGGHVEEGFFATNDQEPSRLSRQFRALFGHIERCHRQTEMRRE